jgi:Arc/MetJ-type ribon-helix-helix transcriptional regulator
LPRPRKRKAVSIDENILEWVEEQIEEGNFHSFNHAVEIALEKLRDSN